MTFATRSFLDLNGEAETMRIYAITNGAVTDWVFAATSEEALEWWSNWKTEELEYEPDEIEEYWAEEESPSGVHNVMVDGLSEPISLTGEQWGAIWEMFRGEDRFFCSTEY